MICARCLMHAVHQLKAAGDMVDLATLPAATTVFQGDAVCLEHYIGVTNLLVWSGVVSDGTVEVEWRDPTND